MKRLKSISVFFPSYNDAKILPYLILKTYSVLPTITDNFEVIVINDGSEDETGNVLKELVKHYPKLIIISHKKNKGYGASLISGFARAKKEWVFYTDGDAQYLPDDLPKLVDKITSGVDVINGFKYQRSDNLIRKIIGGAYNHFCHFFFDLPILDIDCDFRLIRRTKLSKIKLQSMSGIICLELILGLQNIGCTFKEVRVNHYPRPIGHSQFFRPVHLLKSFFELIVFHRSYTNNAVRLKKNK